MRTREQKTKRKGQESTIGKIIYGFLLFSPLIAILTGCLISTFNNQSKQEYQYHYLYETNEVNNHTYNLRVGNVYHLNAFNSSFDEILHNLDACRLRFYNIEKFDIGFFQNEFIDEVVPDDETYNKSSPFIDLIIYGDDSPFYIGAGINLNANEYLYAINTGISSYSSSISIVGDFILVELHIDLTGTTSIINNTITSTSYIPYDSINLHNVSAEDVFYRSVDKVIESPLFNWAQNSIIYTTTASTCNALSITTPFVPLLLSYWLIISVMYFLYDIALMLVWILHRKVHELQDSI